MVDVYEQNFLLGIMCTHFLQCLLLLRILYDYKYYFINFSKYHENQSWSHTIMYYACTCIL